jgi:hypothetical protein
MTQQKLLRGLFDDASLFPPASLAMPAAVAGHNRHATAWYSDLSGPFVCADTRLRELGTALTTSSTVAIDLSLIVAGGADGVADALSAVAADPRLRLRAVEVPAATDTDPVQAARAVAQALDDAPLAAAAAYIEIPLRGLTEPTTRHELLAAIGGRGYRVKLRTGGTTAEAFPDEITLATCLHSLAHRRVPFKCTAGLHNAIRHTAADTGFEHHGFLNVLLAMAAADNGAETGHLTDLLAERDPDRVVVGINGIGPGLAGDVRALFLSLGTCSTDEPVADLVKLGLLSLPR